jgi:uncharacterized protein YukE
MSEVMRLDPTEVRAVAPAVGRLSSAMESALARLAAVLDAEGDCWGDDDIGRAFGGSYRPAQQQLRDGLARLGDGVRGVGDALVAAADRVDAAEDRAAVRLS